MYVWEGTFNKFHGLTGSFSNSPNQWIWISQCSLMSLDVLLREVHEKNEGIFSAKVKTRGLYGKGVHSIWVVLLCPRVHQENQPHTKYSYWDDECDEDKGQGDLL